MLKIVFGKKFLKDVRKAKQRNLDMDKLDSLILRLSNEIPLERKFMDHKLVGEYEGCRECHIQPDWLLIYKIEKNELHLILVRTGTHSDLFD